MLQWLRHLTQLLALGLIFALAYLSLYAHYRASRAIEDEQFLRDFNGRILARIHDTIGQNDNVDAVLEGYKGTLWSMRVGGVDWTDPLAAAEATAASRAIHLPLFVSALLPVALAILLGRVFCSWLCPAGLLFELTHQLRRVLRLAEIKPGDMRFSHRSKYAVLIVGLAIAAAIGLPLFALTYPPAVMSRMAHGLVFGTSVTGAIVLLGVIVAVEVFVSPRWWCRTICPGGALYGLLGWKRLLRVKLDKKSCTGCRDCEPVCPMGLYPVTQSASIECDNCGVCLRHCPTDALGYSLRVTARSKRRAAAAVLLIMLLAPAAHAHHILGLPHYAYKENYPQAPVLEYPATSGPWDILMTCYPGMPQPGEAANVTFYIKRQDTGDVFEEPIEVRVFRKTMLGTGIVIQPRTAVEAFDRTHKLSVTYPNDGEYIVEVAMQIEGRKEIIPFVMVAGEPAAAGSTLAVVGVVLMGFVVIIRAIKIKRKRRIAVEAAPMKRLPIAFPYLLTAVMAIGVVWSNFRTAPPDNAPPRAGKLIDPICNMEVNPAWGFTHEIDGATFYFCSRHCVETFAAEPESYIGERCMVCDAPVTPADAVTATYLGNTYRLDSDACRAAFKADPASYFMHTMLGIPPWLYYISIGVVLLASFVAFETSPRKQARAARVNLMGLGIVRRAILSRPLRFVVQAITSVLFVGIIVAGLFGHQNPAMNIAPLLTWTVWWCGLVVLIMFAGKAWCWMCPWDAITSWIERFSLWKKTEEGIGLDLKWPRVLRNIWLATALFVGLTWVEIGFGITMKPAATAWLAITMLAMTLISAMLFDRKSFCRYGCLVGRVSGLYAMFAGVEVRHVDADVCGSCKTKQCIKGSDDAYGCPTFEYPGKMATNTYCIQCTECLQACPHENLAVNLRPWGADLAVDHAKPRSDEAYLALLMLAISGFHGLTMTPVWSRLLDVLPGPYMMSFTLGMALLLIAPIAVYALLVGISHRMARGAHHLSYRAYFIRYAYCVLPIALFYHLAHNLEHLLMEGPKIIAMSSDPAGRGWNLLGTAGWHIPPLVSLDVLWILQVVLVAVGHLYSLWAAAKISRGTFGDRAAAMRSQWPLLLGMIAFSVFSLWLLKQPMEMRTSAM